MARFYGIRAKEMGQNLNECTRIVNELPRLNRSIPEYIYLLRKILMYNRDSESIRIEITLDSEF